MKPHGAERNHALASGLHRSATASHKEEPRLLNTAGVRRRVIEGEGLGGFARRLTINGTAEGLFRSR
jgi:hypothetical protein